MPKARRCTYPKSDGTPCRSFAAGRSRLCYWHSRQAARDRRRSRAHSRGCTVYIGPLCSRRAIQNALNRVLQSLAAATLPVDRASRYLRRIQVAVFALNDVHHRGTREAEDLSRLANLLAPGTLDLEPSLADLLSLIQPPTIEAKPRPTALLSTRSPTHPQRTAVKAHPHTKTGGPQCTT